MATKISWCDETINPIVGCSKISDGCRECYAENMARRLAAMGMGQYQSVTSFGRWNGLTAFVESELQKPLKWKKSRSIFVSSMGDLFHESVPFEWVDAVMVMIGKARQHTFIMLTKRPERMKAYFANRLVSGFTPREGFTVNPLPNLVLGVSVEDQETANERIPVLMQIPSATRFISLEPMVGPVDLDRIHESGISEGGSHWELWESCLDGKRFDPWSDGWADGFPRLDGVILGGESGSKARSIDPAWVRTIRDQCNDADVPFMFKQWSKAGMPGRPWEYKDETGFPLIDGRTHTELPW